MKSCCFTGYRPNKFPFPFRRNNADYIAMENALTETVLSLAADGVETFYSGMAMGFDLLAADTVLLAKKAFPALRLVAAIPFAEQASGFPPAWKKRYDRILGAADLCDIICAGYSPACFQLRNEYMVKHSDVVVTWFDGQPGGTQNTLRYAEKIGRGIINLCTLPPVQTADHPLFEAEDDEI